MSKFIDKRKVFPTLLNIIGMMIALTAFMVMMVQVRYDSGFDKYSGSEHIFRLELADDDIGKHFSAHMSRPLIEGIKDVCPEVEALCVYTPYGVDHKHVFTLSEESDVLYPLSSAYSDNDVLEVLPFEFVEGNPQDYNAGALCLISQSAARRLFGKESPIGKHLYLEGVELTIVAVYKDFPENSTVSEIIINMGKGQMGDFSEWNLMCFLQLKEKADVQKVTRSLMDRMIVLMDIDTASMSENERDQLYRQIRITPIHDVYYDLSIEDSLPKGNRTTTRTLLAISILVMVIAIINFINFSMASVPFDIKSVNTRKVFGSSRKSLIGRLMLRTLLLMLVAFVLSLPLLELLSGTHLASYVSCSLKVGDNLPTIGMTLAITLLSALLSGVYPAFYSTSFQPALVLKGSFSLSVKGRLLRNLMVGFQYVISFSLAAMALFVLVQTRYMKNYDMGFRSDHVLMVYPVQDQEVFRQKISGNPHIKGVTFAGSELVSLNKMWWGRDFQGERLRLDVLPVSSDFIDFFGLEITEGRGFTPSDEKALEGTFVMNQTTMSEFPVLKVGSKVEGHMGAEHPAEIVGVVKDFNFKPMQYAIQPLALYNFGIEPWWNLMFAYVRISPEKVGETIQYLRDVLFELNPELSSDYLRVEFMDERIGNLYEKEERLSRVIMIVALLSFLISLIGVLGLVYFETQFRQKEIALKKVHGASEKDILQMFNLRYMKLTLISFVVSLPLSYLGIHFWLKDFPYQSPVPVWIFIVPLLSIALVTLLTVSLRCFKIARLNPAESIKNE